MVQLFLEPAWFKNDGVRPLTFLYMPHATIVCLQTSSYLSATCQLLSSSEPWAQYDSLIGNAAFTYLCRVSSHISGRGVCIEIIMIVKMVRHVAFVVVGLHGLHVTIPFVGGGAKDWLSCKSSFWGWSIHSCQEQKRNLSASTHISDLAMLFDCFLLLHCYRTTYCNNHSKHSAFLVVWIWISFAALVCWLYQFCI